MSLSDQLDELAKRIQRLEDAAAAAHEKNKAKLEQQREQFKVKADSQAKVVSAKAAKTKGEAQAFWAATTAKIEHRRDELQTKREQQKAKWDVDSAERYAEGCEEYAEMLLSLAAFVVDSAGYATVDAVIARDRADALKKEGVKV